MTDAQFPPYEPAPEQQLTGDLMGLAEGWAELGIDADDFLKCGRCHRFMRELVDREDVTTTDGTFLPGIPDEECCQCGD